MSSKIQQLATKICEARNHYYNGNSNISDQLFDTWIEELSQLDPKHPQILGIGSAPVSNWEKYTHQVPMGSLNKCQTEEEFTKWYQERIINNQAFFTLKLDGLSVSLIYKDGKLNKAVTRGNGTIGEAITTNVMKMIGVPLKLPNKISATIRGEILLSKQNHQQFFHDYSNPRNAASGISRRYDGVGSDKLSVLVYHVITKQTITSQEEQFKLLQSWGFQVPDYQLTSSINEIISLKNKWQSQLRDQYPFELDGLVIYNNNLKEQQKQGIAHNRPKYAIAYKFDAIYKEAYISEILIQTGHSGRLTPVAVFDPRVDLMGASIERASLHNFSNIKQLGIGVGATVLVCRANDVIPYIQEVITPPASIYEAPLVCPSCGEHVVENGEYVQCVNVQNCPAQIEGRIKNWIKELDILEWGDRIVERLVANNKIVDVADLYTLTMDDLMSIERMGKKSAQTCYQILQQHKQLSLDTFLGSLSIPMVRPATIQMLMSAGYNTLNKIRALSLEECQKINGIGEVKAKSLIDGLQNCQSLINKLITNGIVIMETTTQGKLTGKSFAFTGAMINKRAILEKMANDQGGEVKSSVGRGLTYLVMADSNSQTTKAVAARKFGTSVISETDFLAMVS